MRVYLLIADSPVIQEKHIIKQTDLKFVQE